MSAPTHIIKVIDIKTKDTARVGAGWEKDGYIRIRLDPCVVLDWKDEIMITMFPNDKKDGDNA